MRINGFAALLALSVSAALAACEKPDPNGPAPTVERLYAPYLNGGDTAAALTNAPMTAELHALIDKATLYGNLLDEPVLDFDPIVFAQDMEIKNVRVAEEAPPKNEATVARAQFDNFGKPVVVRYDMKREGGAWLIDNIRGPEGDLRAIVTTAMKPAGDPDAMIAPVKAIYDRYGAKSVPARPVPAIVGWAALAPDFARIMQKRADAIKATDMDPLGFDPVVDGAAWDISNLTFEAASSAVIARFKNGTAEKIIVYDIDEENGAWKIQDIRSPGVWDVRFKLEEAGIK